MKETGDGWRPAKHEETILYADIDLAAVRAARRYFDPVGHYHHPDIFQLHVDTRPRPSVVLRETPSDLSELS
jgi:nitrilase